MYLLKALDSENTKFMALGLLESEFGIPGAYIASSAPDREYFRRLSTRQRKEITSELEGVLLNSHSTPASAPEKFLFDEALWMYTSVAAPQAINNMISQLKDQGTINPQEIWELLVRAVGSSAEAQVIILPSLLAELRSAERTNSLEATMKLYDTVAVIAIHDEEVRAELDAFLRERKPPEWQDYSKELNLEWWIDERYAWSRALGALNGNRTGVIIETILKGKDPLERAGFMSRAEAEVLDLISEQDMARVALIKASTWFKDLLKYGAYVFPVGWFFRNTAEWPVVVARLSPR